MVAGSLNHGYGSLDRFISLENKEDLFSSFVAPTKPEFLELR